MKHTTENAMGIPRPSLEAVAMGVGYAGKVLPGLGAVNLSLFPGQLTALVGPNGAGKSTLLRTLSGLMKPLQGNLLLDGQPSQRWKVRERARKLAVVWTAIPPIGEMRVVDLLRLGRFPHRGWIGDDPEGELKVEHAASDLGLRALLSRPLYRLSDGERQRVLIGRALVQDTPVLLLDEPTHYLDVVQRAEVFQLLANQARQRNRSLLVATHEVEWALQVADYLAVIAPEGLVVGAAENIRHSGLLERVYQSDKLHFDALSGRFLARYGRSYSGSGKNCSETELMQ
ncbi:MAG: ATP-binding cassette domain-containing protein [Bacteroidetes bacterium]|nr:ATP-binding cassette domain-containing protein [Bacteroidota bacterium]